VIGLDFTGGKELAEALGQLPQRVSRSVQRDALLDAAEPMRIEMGRNAPRRPPQPDLADHIIAVSVRGEDMQQVVVAVGPEKRFFYGSFIEFGTAFISARPFARPAFDRTVKDALGIFADRVWLALTARGVRRATSIDDQPVSGPGRLV
jgi:HK97 gp10 family phage protein